MINYIQYFCIGFATLLLTTACSAEKADAPKSDGNESYPMIEETYFTERDERDNVDSPAIWHGPEGQHWLLATAKETDAILAYDATDGSFIKRYGQTGRGTGQFKRPNGVVVIDDVIMVVERDNHRMQVVGLPGFNTLGMIGEKELKRLCGLTVYKTAANGYTVFVTDNYNPALEGYPPEEELDERVHKFRFSMDGDSLKSEHIKAFGDISGDGVLHKVESLFVDPSNNRLLIADEAYNQRSIKAYDLKGNFTGERIIPNTHIGSEPEGIALYGCADGSGYRVITDQHETGENKYVVYDRQTLDYIDAFKGAKTRNTDGIVLTQQPFGDFNEDAFFPVHNDGNVAALPWSAIADSLFADQPLQVSNGPKQLSEFTCCYVLQIIIKFIGVFISFLNNSHCAGNVFQRSASGTF